MTDIDVTFGRVLTGEAGHETTASSHSFSSVKNKCPSLLFNAFYNRYQPEKRKSSQHFLSPVAWSLHVNHFLMPRTFCVTRQMCAAIQQSSLKKTHKCKNPIMLKSRHADTAVQIIAKCNQSSSEKINYVSQFQHRTETTNEANLNLMITPERAMRH